MSRARTSLTDRAPGLAPGIAAPFDYFERIYCVRVPPGNEVDSSLLSRLDQLGLTERVEVLPLDPRVVDPRVRACLGHRSALVLAAASGARCVLVLEDRCLLLADANDRMRAVVAELKSVDWGILSLGSNPDGRSAVPVEGLTKLAQGEFTGSFALAYAAEAVTRLLNELPADPPGLADWLERCRSFEKFIAGLPRRLLCVPHLASIPEHLPYEDPATRMGFLA